MATDAEREAFDGFLKLFKEQIQEGVRTFNLSLQDARFFLGYNVKEISSYMPKDKLESCYVEWVQNPIAKLFVLGSAFPTHDGWDMVTRPYTRFVASGFNSGELTTFQFVVIGDYLEYTEIEHENLTVDDVYSLNIAFQEETADMMELYRSSKPNGIKLN